MWRYRVDVVSNLPNCPVPASMLYRYRYQLRYKLPYRYRGYRFWCTELTKVSSTGIDFVPKLPKCPVPVLMYRTYRSVRYRYWCRTEVTEVSGTGIDVPKFPKCPVPVIPAVYTGGMPRYVPYRTHPWNGLFPYAAYSHTHRSQESNTQEYAITIHDT